MRSLPHSPLHARLRFRQLNPRRPLRVSPRRSPAVSQRLSRARCLLRFHPCSPVLCPAPSLQGCPRVNQARSQAPRRLRSPAQRRAHNLLPSLRIPQPVSRQGSQAEDRRVSRRGRQRTNPRGNPRDAPRVSPAAAPPAGRPRSQRAARLRDPRLSPPAVPRQFPPRCRRVSRVCSPAPLRRPSLHSSRPRCRQ